MRDVSFGFIVLLTEIHNSQTFSGKHCFKVLVFVRFVTNSMSLALLIKSLRVGQS